MPDSAGVGVIMNDLTLKHLHRKSGRQRETCGRVITWEKCTVSPIHACQLPSHKPTCVSLIVFLSD